jgi:hypothetical protein
MGWIDGITHQKDYTFSGVQLNSFTAYQVCRWVKFESMETLMLRRASLSPYTLKAGLGWKHAISYSMINTNMQWHEIAQVESLTPSHQMLRHMRHFRTHHCGIQAEAHIALTPSEFEHINEAYWRLPNRELGLYGVASASFQLSMIGQMDDTLKFCNPNLYPYQIYPDYGMCGRLLWSKKCG